MKNIQKKLDENGFVLIKSFLSKEKEFLDFKKYLLNFFLNAFSVKNKKSVNFNKIITSLFIKKNNVSAYMNDNINLSPHLQKILTSDKILSLLSKLYKIKNDNLIFNNQRFRVQIPNNDKIANLPWHQDSHYNEVKKTKSIVVWISISDISKEMGPIIFKMKSHKLGPLNKIVHKKPNGGISYTVNMNNAKLKKLKSISMNTNSGDIILIDMNSVHKSGINKTINKVKYSAQARYHIVKKFT